MSARSTPSSVRSFSPAARAAHDDRAAAHAVEIERVHRVAELEHHEVGHVDDVRDGPDPERREPPAHVERRRARPSRRRAPPRRSAGSARRPRSRSTRTSSGRLVRALSGAVAAGTADTRRSKRAAASRARPTMPERVGTVGREADLEDRVARGRERLRRAASPARPCPDGSTRMPSPSSPRPSSASLQSIPSLGTPAIIRFSIVVPLAGRYVAERREDHEAPRLRDVGRAAHELLVRDAVASIRDPPWSTVTRRRPPRDGCGRVETTLATMQASAPRPKACVASTSRPAAVRRAAMAVASSGSEGHSSRSHRTEAFIRGRVGHA